jgi:hypothetical protein
MVEMVGTGPLGAGRDQRVDHPTQKQQVAVFDGSRIVLEAKDKHAARAAGEAIAAWQR